MFPDKKVWIKMFKHLWNFFVNFALQVSFGAFIDIKLKLNLKRQLYLVYSRWKFHLCISYRLKKKPDNKPFQKQEKWRFLKTESDVIKTKKSTSNFYYLLSVLKISWNSIKPFLRNRLYKIGQKNNNYKNNREKETTE